MSCLCDYSLSNTGTPSKQGLAAVTKKLIFVRLVTDEGVRNYIENGDNINEAYVLGLTRNQDPSARWYPTPEIKNIEDVRAESVFESFGDGTNAKVRDGARSFTGVMINMGPVFLSKLQGFACERMGVYFVDACGKLVGSVSSDGTKLYPVAIADGSFDATLVKATDAAVNKVMVKFDISQLERDENLRIVETADDVNMLEVEGMIDVIGTPVSTGQTSMVFSLALQYGPFGNPIKAQGFVSGDFSLYNETDDATVAISAATESPAGTYTLTYASQTIADVITVRGQMEALLITPFEVTVA